jgi:hypothetical protein
VRRAQLRTSRDASREEHAAARSHAASGEVSELRIRTDRRDNAPDREVCGGKRTWMASKDQIVCHVCGFKNQAEAAKCQSCGARLEGVSADYSSEEEAARQNQQSGFEIKWVVFACFVYFVFQAIALALLPAVIPSYDPFQSVWGIMISSITWFLGGIVVGLVSPGRTFLEPAVAAVIAVMPTIAYLMWRTPGDPGQGLDPSLLAYTVGGLMGVMISLFGAFLGEKIQGATRGHRVKA